MTHLLGRDPGRSIYGLSFFLSSPLYLYPCYIGSSLEIYGIRLSGLYNMENETTTQGASNSGFSFAAAAARGIALIATNRLLIRYVRCLQMSACWLLLEATTRICLSRFLRRGTSISIVRMGACHCYFDLQRAAHAYMYGSQARKHPYVLSLMSSISSIILTNLVYNL